MKAIGDNIEILPEKVKKRPGPIVHIKRDGAIYCKAKYPWNYVKHSEVAKDPDKNYCEKCMLEYLRIIQKAKVL